MKLGIIAAGIGERLARGGIGTPKPLLPVGGQPLVARIIQAASRIPVSSVACIVNGLQPEVAHYLRSSSWPVPVEVLVKTTPSSMESLFALEPLLNVEPFLLFTVDVVFDFRTLKSFFLGSLELDHAKGVLALTRFVDDEKPLYVTIDEGKRITAMGEAARGSEFITAGFYCFHPEIFRMIDDARKRNLTALRQFLGLLIEAGFPIYGITVPKTIDVDYPEDVAKAEAFLKEINEP